jgi:hypothetical protein
MANLESNATSQRVGLVVCVNKASSKCCAVQTLLEADVNDVQSTNNVNSDSLLLVGLKPILNNIHC